MLLIINPNTSQSVSDLLQLHAQQAAGEQVRVSAQAAIKVPVRVPVRVPMHVRTVTARFGAPYIACEASYAVAGHATLDAWAAALADDAPPPTAILIGCFGDPGLLALRDSSAVPVIGLAEAAFAEAAHYGKGRFAIVTGGARWQPMLERLAHMLGYDRSLAGIHTVAPSGAQLAQDPAAARILLAKACQQAVRAFDAQAIILGGAGLAGMAAAIQARVDVPVIDSVLAGTRQALLLAGSTQPSGVNRFDVQWQRLAPEMMALGR